jgi:rare lipoprotein A
MKIIFLVASLFCLHARASVPVQQPGEVIYVDEDGNKYYAVMAGGGGRNCEARDGGASWYGPGFNGNRTANGEIFDQNEMTAAHKTIKFNSLVEVTYQGRSVVVRINDAGPYVGGRVIDVSKAAAEELGLIAAGHGHVELEVLRCGDEE